MIISEMIAQLKVLKETYGDVQVTCTHALVEDGYNVQLGRPSDGIQDVYETTADNLLVSGKKPEIFGESHIRICM